MWFNIVLIFLEEGRLVILFQTLNPQQQVVLALL